MQKTGFRHWLKNRRASKALAAAAVILIAVGLFMSMFGKKIESVEDFYAHLGEVENICVSTFEPGRTEPIQQVWTSQDLKVRLFKTGIGDRAKYDVLDLSKKMQTTIYLSNVKTEPLTEEKLRDLRQSMTPSFALAPFFTTDDLPDKIKWRRVNDQVIISTIPGCIVYELIWEIYTPSVGITHKKWRIFLDPDTHLPKRTETHVKSESDVEYRLEKFVVVTYPDKNDIREIVANTYDRSRGSTGDPSYIGTPGIDP
jgi:hypothetical protein